MLFLFFITTAYLLTAAPGLKGGFVLDDWPNLSALEKVKSWQGIWDYTLSGPASSVGRQIAYFSFAVQSEHWPHNPFPFKALNLLIHIINALLCCICCYLLALHLKFNRCKATAFASLCTFLWLFLPLHASTVFYVVQRMTLLAGLFTFLGILGLLLGSIIEVKGQASQGRWLATIFTILAYSFGILSKENAVLLGIFLSVLYFFIIRKNLKNSKRWWDLWLSLIHI